jgi:hypothetical protein
MQCSKVGFQDRLSEMLMNVDDTECFCEWNDEKTGGEEIKCFAGCEVGGSCLAGKRR